MNESEATNKHKQQYDDEYRLAQRAAVESILIGRETLETAMRQGDQLQNAENLADETEYKMDRATRLLKGMTWSGWLANKFSSDIEPPEYKKGETSAIEAGPPREYEDVPDFCIEATQAIQNYHCNVDVLEACDTEENEETCTVICNSMYRQAHSELKKLLLKEGGDKETRMFASQLQKDLTILRERQGSLQKLKRTPTRLKPPSNKKADLFQTPPSTSSHTTKSDVETLQEDHLDAMARHLDEIGSLATNLNGALSHHADTLEALDEKMESNLLKSNLVTRRTDRLIQKKSWRKMKPTFVSNFSIFHIKSQKYLSVSASSSLVLSTKFNETCIFGLWNRQGKIFGLQSKYSQRWIGQNLIGSLVCTATKFDRREEWDADGDDWLNTPLVCCSSGWGNGGYLLVSADDDSISIGGGALEDRKNAALWRIKDEEKNLESP